MCAIIASYDLQALIQLINVNRHRGSGVWSMTMFTKNGPDQIHQIQLDLDFENIKRGDSYSSLYAYISTIDTPKLAVYFVIHLQTSTISKSKRKDFSTASDKTLQPVTDGNKWLVHNGIEKETSGTPSEFDTQLLFNLLTNNSMNSALEIFNGSFSALYYNGTTLYAFRNTSCPLYIDPKSMNISSVTCELANVSIDSGEIYLVSIFGGDGDKFKPLPYLRFKPRDNDYYFVK